ncbi:MAG: hypothetical protein H5U38_00585 [Calditrichaeota bacterium]|nr:hypothetical protein [Calditrichota bacterium]
MRLFAVSPDGEFKEFTKKQFATEHSEQMLEEWLEKSPDAILEDSKLLVIGRQVTTNLGSSIDLLGLDRSGAVVVVELKRGRTPRETLAQALEYASYVEQLDAQQLDELFQQYIGDESLALADYHREYFDLPPDEAVAFNKEQRIVIVGQEISGPIRQTSSFLRKKGIKVTCVEFSYFESEGAGELLGQDIVVGEESAGAQRPQGLPAKTLTPDEFLADADEFGRPVFKSILDFAARRKLPIHWGSTGFSLGVEQDGLRIPVLFCYNLGSVTGQSIYYVPRRGERMGIAARTAIPEAELDRLRNRLLATNLFVATGGSLKCSITRRLTDEEVAQVINWLEDVIDTVSKHGLKT